MKSNDKPYEVCTEWPDDSAWTGLEGLLPMGIAMRLARVNRALYASSYIANMLVKDERGKAVADSSVGVVYSGLSVCDVEALGLAMVELNAHAMEALDDIRDNDHGCCGHRQETDIRIA